MFFILYNILFLLSYMLLHHIMCLLLYYIYCIVFYCANYSAKQLNCDFQLQIYPAIAVTIVTVQQRSMTFMLVATTVVPYLLFMESSLWAS